MEVKVKTGEIFGYLTPTGKYEIRGRRIYWECLCVCGKIHFARPDCLKDGKCKSCGCKKAYGTSVGLTIHGCARDSGKHLLYGVYHSVRRRCHSPEDNNYHKYGAKGIIMCDEWFNSFPYFYSWAINNGYKKGLTIERMDPKGNYEPSNCKWETNKRQQRNKIKTVYITAFGETKTIPDWVEDIRCKVSRHYIYDTLIRRKKNIEPELVITGEYAKHK
jgi:hypothetical protein